MFINPETITPYTSPPKAAHLVFRETALPTCSQPPRHHSPGCCHGASAIPEEPAPLPGRLYTETTPQPHFSDVASKVSSLLHLVPCQGEYNANTYKRECKSINLLNICVRVSDARRTHICHMRNICLCGSPDLIQGVHTSLSFCSLICDDLRHD